jgi:dTDP-4-amino-4,6-dideoxygalactose transaminase
VGSLGDCAAFSFCQDKIMTTGGEGGMLVMNDRDLWEKAWAYKDHGKSYDAVFNREHPPGFRWLHESFGSNFRMTEMQAAIGRLQLGKLPHGWRRGGAMRRMLDEGFAAFPACGHPAAGGHRPCLLQVLRLRRARGCWRRAGMRRASTRRSMPRACPALPAAVRRSIASALSRIAAGGRLQRLPAARRLGETSLMFMVHPTLGEAEMAATVGAVAKVMRAAAR